MAKDLKTLRVIPNWNSFLTVGLHFFVLAFCQDYNPENSALLSSARNSPQDSVSRYVLLTRFDFETAFASCSAFLGSVINHQEWFAPETNLAGEVTGLEGDQGSQALAEFLLGSTWGQHQPVWNLIGKLTSPFGKGQLLRSRSGGAGGRGGGRESVTSGGPQACLYFLM